MKRIQEKVKDIVAVCSYQSLVDFTADPGQTLSNYHFTDATSELMAKWLDKIANVQSQNGAANALAGYRGVGKSHFLATLGALVSHPELRSRVTDSHVASSAQRLLRRHYPIAYIRRGTHETLIEEFNDGIAKTFELDVSTLGDSLSATLKTVCEKSGELPFILIIDTAFERGTRVTRDDGPFLGEIAEAAKDLNIFVGVALDDDIAGADGTNSAIARTFNIDFLDQEHLYKVVNAHIFPKNSQMQPILHDIYNYFREVLPNFRWSEQRFSALYPLHPAILEVAPFVRLYVHDFALLGFASEAGERILGRPANSLIALDEVFDTAEKGLRKIDDLAEAFAAYDTLNRDVVAKIPVMQRLQAKLILKALLLLSLDGQGATAGEISASMLIFDEADPENTLKSVEDLIQKFADALPDDVQAETLEGRETRYGFKVSSKDNLNTALGEAISGASPDIVPKMMRRLMQERFSDCTFSPDLDENIKDSMDCQIAWRGGFRRGRIHWNSDGNVETAGQVTGTPDYIDWEVVVDLNDGNTSTVEKGTDVALWHPDELRKDEIETLLRYHALSTQAELREQFSEQVRASMHSHALSAAKILNRSLLEDGKLVIDNFDYNFTEDARTAPQLSELFSIMLEPFFESRYPDHPYFAQKLGMTEASTLITDLYNGTRQNLPEVQQLAHTFALPLGLVRLEGSLYIPESEENLANLPLAAEILKLVGEAGDEGMSLKSIYSEWKKAPYGLVREAQHLILTALVAQRLIEFVTSKGDRINRRSLDLKIIWDDIVGVAKPVGTSFSAKRLVTWAGIFTGNASFKSLDSAGDREILRAAFQDWINEWRESRILERFNELPDDILNTKSWNLAARSSKSLGSVADNIKAALDDTISLEECLNRVADTFSDSEEEMRNRLDDLGTLDYFVKGVAQREEILSYLSMCELTQNESIEQLRTKLLELADTGYAAPSEANNREIGYIWEKFQREFSDLFAAQHNIVMKSHYLQEKFGEILRSDEWWEFENLSKLPIFSKNFWNEARDICRQFGQLDCGFDVNEALKTQPFCMCGFSLSKIAYWEDLPQLLSETIGIGLESYRDTLAEEKKSLVPLAEKFAKQAKDPEVSAAADELVNILRKGDEMPRLTGMGLSILRTIVEDAGNIQVKQSNSSKITETKSEGRHLENPAEWADELADDAVLINI